MYCSNAEEMMVFAIKHANSILIDILPYPMKSYQQANLPQASKEIEKENDDNTIFSLFKKEKNSLATSIEIRIKD